MNLRLSPAPAVIVSNIPPVDQPRLHLYGTAVQYRWYGQVCSMVLRRMPDVPGAPGLAELKERVVRRLRPTARLTRARFLDVEASARVERVHGIDTFVSHRHVMSRCDGCSPHPGPREKSLLEAGLSAYALGFNRPGAVLVGTSESTEAPLEGLGTETCAAGGIGE